MYKGFYNLTSGMLTQQRNLNVVSNNLVNISTAGFKEERYTASTFDEVLFNRVGNKRKDYTGIGNISYIRATSEIYTNYDQGIPEPTGIPLDFAIEGDGFFAVQTENNGTIYTRAGSFSLDDDGYLCFPGHGRVLGRDSQPIRLSTDKIEADNWGQIYTETGVLVGQLGVFTFEDNGALEHEDEGIFTGENATLVERPTIHWKYLERSNVDMVRQMTEMLTCQRALQSAAQAAKIYDQLMTKATTDVGRL
ncbi:flagellar hook-basal body protein [Pseudoflavonifractor sp. 524-17]|uniref:flagellar hook-basal body protein n=1 Tax=Pseudoflavonifractor sp. 524-17 TaxID=2304577 RepID=UPI001379712E|nr:flagellar hook-basal body protein [Pseudoflavonifractor sp. 524-17]NCE65530.1 flagellar hook-basal body protein [Pseudoflavonifractor sp. 524-17]